MTNSQVVSTEIKKYKFSENAFLPKIVTVPITQERKCNCKCLVKIGDVVKEGDVIAEPEDSKVLSAKIHSPIPGKVIDIVTVLSPNGHFEKSVKIKLEGTFSYTGKKIEEKDWKSINPKTLIKNIAELGIINTFVVSTPISLAKQLEKRQDKKDVVLIVRLFDEDRLRLSDSLLAKFELKNIVTGAKITAQAMNAEKIVFVADKKLELLDEIDFSNDTSISVLKMKINKYPIGYKREIINAFNKNLKKISDFTIDSEDLFVDAYAMFSVYKAIVYGIPSVSNYVNFSGQCIPASCFLNVKVGFTLRDIVEQLGGFVHQPTMIVINGMICGNAINNLDIPITKYVKSVEFISRYITTDTHIYNCINCGNCRQICQVNISPDILFQYMQNRTELNEQIKNSALLCTKCALCNSVCPSRLPLSQTISVLKEELKVERNEK